MDVKQLTLLNLYSHHCAISLGDLIGNTPAWHTINSDSSPSQGDIILSNSDDHYNGGPMLLGLIPSGT